MRNTLLKAAVAAAARTAQLRSRISRRDERGSVTLEQAIWAVFFIGVAVALGLVIKTAIDSYSGQI